MPDTEAGEHGIGQEPSDSAGSPGDGPREPGEFEHPEMRTGDEPQVPEGGMAPGGPPDPGSDSPGVVRTAVLEVAMLIVVVGWLAFWLNVAHLNVQAGGLPEAILTTVLFAAPPALVYVWHVNRQLGLVEPPALPSVVD